MSDFKKEMDEKLASSSQHQHYTCQKRNIIILNKISSSSLSSNTIDFQIENDPLKTTILYKVAPRKFHIIINIAPLKNPKIRQRFPILPFENNNFLQGRPRKFHIIINIAPLKNPKIRKRWPILPFENNHFLQGRPLKISCNHQHRPIKKLLKRFLRPCKSCFLS